MPYLSSPPSSQERPQGDWPSNPLTVNGPERLVRRHPDELPIFNQSGNIAVHGTCNQGPYPRQRPVGLRCPSSPFCSGLQETHAIHPQGGRGGAVCQRHVQRPSLSSGRSGTPTRRHPVSVCKKGMLSRYHHDGEASCTAHQAWTRPSTKRRCCCCLLEVVSAIGATRRVPEVGLVT